jgi:hypothetical protein
LTIHAGTPTEDEDAAFYTFYSGVAGELEKLRVFSASPPGS